MDQLIQIPQVGRAWDPRSLFRVHHGSAGDGLDPVSQIAELVGSGQHC